MQGMDWDENEPPPTGEISLVVSHEPVSLQARRSKKDALTEAIKAALGRPGFFLSGDVAINVEWLIHERVRYEAATSPDVDNVVKVILDALCGPDGLLINDCQVQAISCCWIDWTRENQRITIQIRYFPDDWIQREGVRFIRFADSLCLPINSRTPPAQLLGLLDLIEERLKLRKEVERLTGSYDAGKLVMPIQRVFHVCHLRGFIVVDAGVVRKEFEGDFPSRDA